AAGVRHADAILPADRSGPSPGIGRRAGATVRGNTDFSPDDFANFHDLRCGRSSGVCPHLQPVPRPQRAFFDRRQCLLGPTFHKAQSKAALQPPPPLRDRYQLDLVAKAVAKDRTQIADAVDETPRQRFPRCPDLAAKEFRGVALQAAAAPLLDLRLE